MTEFIDQPNDIVESHPGLGPVPGDNVLPGASSAPTGRRSRRRGHLLAIGAGVVAVTVVAAGGVAVGMSLSGGGGQPEDLVPADAVAYLDVDLDPAAGQKVDALRFFRHFPSAESALGNGDDLRAFIAKAFTSSSVDYASQIQPWLGKRYAVAVLPGARSGPPTVEGVLQVTDEALARQDLPKVFPSGYDFTVTDGFAVITSSPASAESLVSQARQSSLGRSSAFTDALAPYGDGVASFYVDVPGLDQLAKGVVPGLGGALSTSPLFPQQVTGAIAGVVKFEPDAVEVLAGGPASGRPGAPSTLVTTLPDTTAAAIGISGSGDTVAKMWDPMVSQMSAMSGRTPAEETAQLERASGLTLPVDLIALLGSQLSLSVDSQGLAGFPLFGYQAETDPTTAQSGMSAVTKLMRKAGVSLTTTTRSDGIVMASTPGYANTLASADGTLGSSPAFLAAVPDADGAAEVVYVDLATILDATGVATSKDLAPLKSLGASVHADGGRDTYRMRLTVSGG